MSFTIEILKSKMFEDSRLLYLERDDKREVGHRKMKESLLHRKC